MNPFSSSENELYKEHILDLYKNPHNFGKIDPCSFECMEQNPLCGDEFHLSVKLADDQLVEDIRFEGQGCAISMASASLFTDFAKGKTFKNGIYQYPAFA